MGAIAGSLTLLGRATLASPTCPPLALSLVLDGSGSIHKNARTFELTLGGWVQTRGSDSVKALADTIFDRVRHGVKDKNKEHYASLWFDNQAYEIAGLTSDFRSVRSRTRTQYRPGRGCTNIKAAIDKSVQQLASAPKDLPKLMVIVSDGEPTVGGATDRSCDAGAND